jgi:hypothetical protein
MLPGTFSAFERKPSSANSERKQTHEQKTKEKIYENKNQKKFVMYRKHNNSKKSK